MTPNKKVLILIVEGKMDAALFKPYLDGIIDSSVIQVHVTNGDIFSDRLHANQSAEELVKNIVEKVRETYYFEPEDIFHIVQLCDLDGIYIPDHHFTVQSTGHFGNQSYYYDTRNKKVLCKDEHAKKSLQKTWQQKRNFQHELIHKETIDDVPYRLYFYALTLEHYLIDDILEDNDEKWDCIYDFIDEYPNLEDFITFSIKPDKCLGTQYDESWRLAAQRDDYYTKGQAC